MRIVTKTAFIYQLLGLFTLFGFGTFFGTIIAENTNSIPLKTIKITSSDWCPYVCQYKLRNKGLIVEVVNAALKEVGLKTEHQYAKSFKRAIQDVTTGVSDILLDADQEHREVLDFAENFYVIDEAVFATLKNSNITLNYPKDLWKYKLGVIAEYLYDEKYGPWEKHITDHPNALKINDELGEPHLLELLARNRIDIALVNWDVARYKLNETQLKQFRTIEKGVSTNLHLGFTRSDRGRKIKMRFEQGFNRLIDTEKLKSIYTKYHIKMPDFSITE